jgi:hypothetical protein
MTIMKLIMAMGEWLTGILLDVLTIPAVLLGLITGLRGGVRYFKIKSM